MPLSKGDNIGPYEIVAALGAGGMGEVYRAKDTRLKRDVALKVLLEVFARDPERMARFQREAQVLAALNHPHIASIYGLEEGALIMELVEGATLSCPLPVDTALRYARQIAEALEYAHERGVIHRDLKPANVKVTGDGVVKLLDFGLAKAIENPTSAVDDSSNSPTLTLGVTKVGVIIGTAAYMSPEQVRSKEADRRADIWSFGVVLYEMLAGERPFRGESVSDTLASVLKIDPDWKKLPAATPPSIRKLVERCLTKDRKQRLQAIGEARIALEAALAGDGAEEETAPAARSRPRRGVFALTATAGVLALVAGIGWWTAWRSQRPADNSLLRLSVDPGPDAIAGGHITAALSPDGNRMAFPVRGHDGKTLLATRLLDQPRATVLAGTEGADDPFFSHDGQWIGFFAEGKMKKTSVGGSAVVVLCDAPNGRGADWGEDDNIIATLNGNSGTGLSLIPAAGGTPQAVTRPTEKGDATHRWPQILPGGQSILFTANKTISNYDGSSIEVLSRKTGEVKVLKRSGYFGRYLSGGYLVFINRGTVFGAAFDLASLELRGTPVPLIDDVAADSNTAGGQVSFSRNGRAVYLSGKSPAATWTLSWLDTAGKIQPLLAAPGVYYEPRLSPDGKLLAFSSGTDIEIYDLMRETRTHLTFATQTVNNCPVWAPDGKHIVFVSEGTAGFALQWIRADGAGEAKLLLESRKRLGPYSFSSDGKYVAFSQENAQTGSGLWTLPVDSKDPERPTPGKPELFLETRFYEQQPSFSPDGRWIAYVSDESGRNEIFVRPFSAGGSSGSGRWLISSDGGRFPIWSRDGRELFYESPDKRIMAAACIAKGDSFAAGKPRPWSTPQFLDIDGHWLLDREPEGKRFVVALRAGAASEPERSVHLNFLLNFPDEVGRRVSRQR